MKKINFHNNPVSIIIPLHNEESIIVPQVNKLRRILKNMGVKNYEVVLIENGSKDQTFRLAYGLTQKDSRITVIKASLPHYGHAIKKGLLSAKNDPIIQLDLDLIDGKFIRKAMEEYGQYDILIGSKFLGSKDERSIYRKFLSQALKKVINILFGYYGTDTHGIKAYKRDSVMELIKDLPMTKHMFDTSIVIAAEINKLIVNETPVNVKEIRPSRFPSKKRIIEAIFDILALLGHRILNSIRIEVVKLKFPIPFI